jgi:hypothetical protein
MLLGNSLRVNKAMEKLRQRFLTFTRKSNEATKSKKRKAQSTTDTTLRFVFGDFAFALLPIAVVTLIRFILGRQSIGFDYLAEWSFAAVYFFGLCITQTIDLKTRVQSDTSYRLDLLTRLYVLFLIVSAIILAIVVLLNNGLELPQDNPNPSLLCLGAIQLLMLFVAFTFLYGVQTTKINFEIERKTLPDSISQAHYYLFLRQALNSAEEQLEYTYVALSRRDTLTLGAEDDESATEMSLDEYSFDKELDNLIRQVETTIKDVRAEHRRVAGVQKLNRRKANRPI